MDLLNDPTPTRSPSLTFAITSFVTPVLSRGGSLVSPAVGVVAPEPAVAAAQALVKMDIDDEGESEQHSQPAEPPVPARIANSIVFIELGAKLEPALVLRRLSGVAKSNMKKHIGKKDKSLYLTLPDMPSVSCIQLWCTGKLIVYGKSVDAARAAATQVLVLLREAGFAHLNPSAVTVKNVVGEAACGFAVNLQALAEEYPAQSRYDPAKRSPEVNFRLNSGVKLRVFSSGKVSIQGAKSTEAVHAAWRTVYPILCRVAA